VVATAAADLPAEAFARTPNNLALNLRGNGRSTRPMVWACAPAPG